jgi:hypothetical protein
MTGCAAGSALDSADAQSIGAPSSTARARSANGSGFGIRL